jgi:hypothetical protein
LIDPCTQDAEMPTLIRNSKSRPARVLLYARRVSDKSIRGRGAVARGDPKYTLGRRIGRSKVLEETGRQNRTEDTRQTADKKKMVAGANGDVRLARSR